MTHTYHPRSTHTPQLYHIPQVHTTHTITFANMPNTTATYYDQNKPLTQANSYQTTPYYPCISLNPPPVLHNRSTHPARQLPTSGVPDDTHYLHPAKHQLINDQHSFHIQQHFTPTSMTSQQTIQQLNIYCVAPPCTNHCILKKQQCDALK